MSVLSDHEAALLEAGFEAMALPHDTLVRAEGGGVSYKMVDMVVTHPEAERAKALGINLLNDEALNLTLSLSALGYRPRINADFFLDGKKWKVKFMPPNAVNLVRITIKRTTS